MIESGVTDDLPENLPKPHRFKRWLQAALLLFLAVHVGYAWLAYSRFSLLHALLLGMGVFILLLLVYGGVAYLLLPWLWSRHYRHPAVLEGTPKITHTKEGIPGDPLNIGLAGTEAEIVQAMLAAKWLPADPASLQTVLGIVKNILFHEPDPQAPVSNLYLNERKQDLAFERLEGTEVKKRHHVRFWKAPAYPVEGKTLWIGAATFDQNYRISRYTGQILHRIAPEIDSERDRLIRDLAEAGVLEKSFTTPGLGVTLNGRNGEGDWYYTDGQIVIGVLRTKDVSAQGS